MTVQGNESRYEIYPRKYFDASPTWFVWNKLTIRDVSKLRHEPGFRGQDIWFYRNHPMQYVSLMGIVSQIELGGGQSSSKFCFFCLDDGSGETIEVKVNRRSPEDVGHPSNTTVDGLNCQVTLASAVLSIAGRPLNTGDIVRARGTVSTYRNARQLELKLIKVVTTTAEEVETWSATARWKRDVLSKPWSLTPDDIQRIEGDLAQRNLDEQEHQQQKRDRHAAHAEKRSATEARRALKEAQFNAGALSGSEIVKTPWD